jgi:ubiquinone/menaquinone biosynthesis C-methylase UbiE
MKMKKKDKWLSSQKLEKEYYYSGKSNQWGTPHSLEYWLKFLQIDKLEGVGIEIGCGATGISNFTEQVIGIDSINYQKRNFVHGIGESLPFQSKSFDFVICCNSLDHCQNPQLVVDEMIRVSNKLIVHLNVFPQFVSWMLNVFDKIHPYHFTKKDLANLFSNMACKKKIQKSIYVWYGKRAFWKGKTKLFIATILGVKGVCLYLEMRTTNNDKSIKMLWQKHWKTKSTLEESSSFLGILLRQKRLKILKNILKEFDHSLSVLDMGCGGGTTLIVLKDSNFKNIIGIDFTPESIEHCEKCGFVYGKDIFMEDAKQTSFPDNSFDIVFSEGLWEHFPDPRLYMAEATRLAKRYIIVIQPNHFSFFGRLMHIGWNLFSKNKGGVREYSFPLFYFSNFLKLYGFKLIASKSTILQEQTVMVFEKSKVI